VELADHLLAIARHLDVKNNVQNTTGGPYLVTVDDEQYLVKPVNCTTAEMQQVDAAIDVALSECERQGIDPRLLLAGVLERVCDALPIAE